MDQESSYLALQRQLYLEARCTVVDLQRECQRLQKLNKVLRSDMQMYKTALQLRDEEIEGYHMEKQGLKFENECLKERLHSCSCLSAADTNVALDAKDNHQSRNNKKKNIITASDTTTDETVASDSESEEGISPVTFDRPMNPTTNVSLPSSIAMKGSTSSKSRTRSRRRKHPKIHETDIDEDSVSDSEHSVFFSETNERPRPRCRSSLVASYESITVPSVNNGGKTSPSNSVTEASPFVASRSDVINKHHEVKGEEENDDTTTRSCAFNACVGDITITNLDQQKVKVQALTCSSRASAQKSSTSASPSPSTANSCINGRKSNTVRNKPTNTSTSKSASTRNHTSTFMATSRTTGRTLLIPRGLTDNVVSYHFERKK